MNIHFREVKREDKDFILQANKEINKLSNLFDSTLNENIEKDIFENKIAKVIIAEVNDAIAGFVLYSYIYWANCGKGIYLSQVYVKEEYRKFGVFKKILQELKSRESDCHFITDYVGNENEVMLHAMEKLDFKSSDLKIYYKKIND